MLQLRVIDEDGYEVVVPFIRDEISIGRKAGNTIRLTERNISRHHALLTREETDLFVDDLDSYNGVILNGNRIARKSGLYEGDLLEIGDYKIRVERAHEARGRVELDETDEQMDQLDLEPDEAPAVLAEADKAISEVKQKQAMPPKAPRSAKVETTLDSDTVPVQPTAAAATQPEAPPSSEASKPPEPLRRPTPVPGGAGAPTLMLEAVDDEPPVIEDDTPVAPQARAPEFPAVDPPPATPPVVAFDEDTDDAVDLEQPAQVAPDKNVYDGKLAKTPMPDTRPRPISEPMPEPTPAIAAPMDLPEEDWDLEPGKRRPAGMALLLAGFAVAAVVGAILIWQGLEGNAPPATDEPALVAVDASKTSDTIPEAQAIRENEAKATQTVKESVAAKKRELAAQAEAAGKQEETLRTKAIQASLEEARRLIGEEQWSQAERVLTDLLAQLPDVEQAKSLREQVRGERQHASDYQKAIKGIDSKEYYLAVLLLGGIDEDSVYYARAQIHLDTAKARLVRQYTAEGWRAYKSGDYADALRQAEKALALIETDSDAQQLKKASRVKLKQAPAKSAKPAAEAEMSATQHYNVAVNYYGKTQYKQAIQHFKAALKQNPQMANAWRGLGVCYAITKQMDEAMRAYKRYLDLAPNAPDAPQVRKYLEDYQRRQ